MKFHIRERARLSLMRLLLLSIILGSAFFRGYEANGAIVRSFTDTLTGHQASSQANHTVKFTSPTGVGQITDTIVVTFDTGFSVSGMDFGDVDLSHGPTLGTETEETLAAAAAAGTWGASFSGQKLTLTPPTDAGGSEIAASDIVIFEIGTNATTGVAGDTSITNPSSAGSYRVFVGGAFGDEGSVAVPIVSSHQVTVSATVSAGPPEGGGPGPGPGPPPPPPPPDVTPPVISNIQVLDITEAGARITWSTDEPATSIVEYGTTVAYGSEAGDALSLFYSHSVVLGGLLPDTVYHFRVKSADGSGNLATSSDDTFETLSGVDVTPPVISAITVTDITGARATINWETNELADGTVEYGTGPAYGTSVSDPTLVTNHSLTLIGLTPNTLYHFRVRGTDSSGNEGFSSDQTFSTTDVTPPVISNIQVVDITETSARVTWDTDESADSKVDYGLTAGYGSVRSSAALIFSHSLLITGLTGGTTYHFSVTSADGSGNSATSLDDTFLTAPDVTPPPNVNNFRVTGVTDTSISLAWDPPANPDYRGVRIVMKLGDYPTGIGDGVTVYDGSGVSENVGGLTPDTTYFFTAFAYDAVRNYASGALASGRTLAFPPPVPPPVEPPTIPPPIIPPEIPPVPPIPLPPVTVPPVERISLNDVHFYVVGRTLELFPADGVVRGLTNLMVTVTVSRDAFTRTPRRVILNVGSNSYLMEENIARNAFEVGFTLPSSTGNLPSGIIVQYADASEDAVPFAFSVQPSGIVFERSNGIRVPVERAEVTLLERDGGKVLWDAGAFAQENPLITANSGAYYFLVPPGSYSLEAEKPGYRRGESPVFIINDAIVNRDIEIFRVPESLLDVIKPDAPLAENIIAVAKNLAEKTVFLGRVGKEQLVKVIDNPQVETVNETVAVPAIIAVAVANVGLAAGLGQLLNFLRFLLTQPLVFLDRKKRRGWGVVYNSLSKLPVDLVIVRLLELASGRILATRVTDREGRYAFIIGKGSYKIEVTKNGFIFPTALLKAEKEDAGFLDLYHGEAINVNEESITITANIPLDPLEVVEVPTKVLVKKYLKKANFLVSVSGIVLSMVSFVIAPGALFAGFIVLQILLYALFRRIAAPKRVKSWGIVYDERDKKPLRFAIARIFETKYNKLLETQVTDTRGRYNFLVGKSAYYVTYEKFGYETKQSEVIDLSSVAKPEVIAKDMGLKKQSP